MGPRYIVRNGRSVLQIMHHLAADIVFMQLLLENCSYKFENAVVIYVSYTKYDDISEFLK